MGAVTLGRCSRAGRVAAPKNRWRAPNPFAERNESSTRHLSGGQQQRVARHAIAPNRHRSFADESTDDTWISSRWSEVLRLILNRADGERVV